MERIYGKIYGTYGKYGIYGKIYEWKKERKKVVKTVYISLNLV